MASNRNKPCACGSGIKTKKCCDRPPTKEELQEQARLAAEAKARRDEEIHAARIERRSETKHPHTTLALAMASTMILHNNSWMADAYLGRGIHWGKNR